MESKVFLERTDDTWFTLLMVYRADNKYIWVHDFNESDQIRIIWQMTNDAHVQVFQLIYLVKTRGEVFVSWECKDAMESEGLWSPSTDASKADHVMLCLKGM